MRVFIAATVFLSSICLYCTGNSSPPRLELQEYTTPLNMRAVTGSAEISVFHEARRVNDLPRDVREAFRSDGRPRRAFQRNGRGERHPLAFWILHLAAVSDRYSIVTYTRDGEAIWSGTAPGGPVGSKLQ